MTPRTYVYFMKPVDLVGPIKIGSSSVPQRRLEQLSVWSPFPLEVIAMAPGDLRMERVLHTVFAADRLHREWFRPCRGLLNLIRAVQGGEPLGEAVDLLTGEERPERAADRLNSVDDLFLHLGGPADVARVLGKRHSTASEMKRRSSIPVEHWPAILGSERGQQLRLTADDLMRLHAPSKTERAA